VHRVFLSCFPHLLAMSLFMALPVVDAEALVENEADAPPITGKEDPKLASFDRMMTAFVKRHKVPGVTLAVAKDGRLVYARGFGFADVQRRQPAEAHSLMRIASVSKPITAVGILLLVQQGKLKLTDHVWDVLRPFEMPHYPRAKLDPRWQKITILELLQHTGGWDRDTSFDPMFRPLVIARALEVPPPPKARDVLCYMMGQPLDFEPGERYAYSNFGYCVLGRVIETLSGQTYEHFVQRQILAPLGIQDMRIGKSPASQRAPGEVTYYAAKNRKSVAVVGPEKGQRVPTPYGAWDLESLDSHGGWLASAPDLVRFGSALDRPGRPGVLTSQSLKTLFARPTGRAGFTENGKPRASYYACGWRVRPVSGGKVNTWHAGLLDGTESLLARRWDGLTWAVLFNTGGPGQASLASAIDPLIHQAADQVKTWPTE